jgi:hypothetical protein
MFVAGSTTGSASRCSWAPCASSAPSWLTPTDVPELVVVHVAAQLGIADPGVFKGYAQRRSSQWEHAEQIRTAYGYRDFSDPDPACCSTGPPPASSRTKCCYPDPACERLITTVREQATQQLHTELAALPEESSATT